MYRFEKAGIGVVILIGSLMWGCARTREPEEEIDIVTVTEDAHTGFSHQLARTNEMAEAFRIGAGVADLAARSTVENEAFRLRQELDRTMRLEASLAEVPISSESDVVTEMSNRMHQSLTSAQDELKTADGMLRQSTIDKVGLESVATEVSEHVRSAAVEHQALLDLVTDPSYRFVRHEVIQPRHSVSANLSMAGAALDRMMGMESTNPAEWVPRWRGNWRIVEEHLSRARTDMDAFKDSDAAVMPLADMVRDEVRVTEDRMDSLRMILASGVPDREAARGEAQAARTEVTRARESYRELLEAEGLIPYPEYDLDSI